MMTRQPHEDLPWEKLAAGELSAEEEAALRATAEQSEEGRRLFELYRPFDGDEKQRLFGAVRVGIQGDSARRRRRYTTIATITIVALVVAVVAAAATRAVRHERAHTPGASAPRLSNSSGPSALPNVECPRSCEEW
jgi:hypothetical protein